MSSPTSRSLETLRDEGWTASVVEKTIRAPGRIFKRDCFGFDILAVRADGQGALGIQACAGDSHAARKAKLLGNVEAAIWIAAGNRIEVWSWRKAGARGKRKVWTLRREALTLSEFIPAEAA